MAIEKNAKEAVEAEFADELKNGTLVFRTIDISEPKNEVIAENMRLHGLRFHQQMESKQRNVWKSDRICFCQRQNCSRHFQERSSWKSPYLIEIKFYGVVTDIIGQQHGSCTYGFSFGIAYGDFALPIGYEYRCYRIYR